MMTPFGCLQINDLRFVVAYSGSGQILPKPLLKYSQI
jgi:hypothetical protein